MVPLLTLLVGACAVTSSLATHGWNADGSEPLNVKSVTSNDAKIDSKGDGWCSVERNPVWEIQLNKPYLLNGIRTKSPPNGKNRVKAFTVEYLQKGKWFKLLGGKSLKLVNEGGDIVVNSKWRPVLVRAIRIKVQDHTDSEACSKFNFIGKQGVSPLFDINTNLLRPTRYRSTKQYGRYGANKAIFGETPAPGWCSQSRTPMWEVTLPRPIKFSGLRIKAGPRGKSRALQYRVAYYMEARRSFVFAQNGRYFNGNIASTPNNVVENKFTPFVATTVRIYITKKQGPLLCSRFQFIASQP